MEKGKAWLKGLINEEGIVTDMHLLGRLDEQYWKNENIKINKGRLFYLIDQLDEPEKPVIPQFVADWIEKWKREELILRDWSRFNLDDENEYEVAEWLYDNDDDEINILRKFTLIDAIRYGYEVEKEKLYHVVNKENYFMLRKYDGLVGILHISSSMSRDECGKDTRFMLTEKEIKDYDERYWAFAEEVTE